MSGPLRSQLSAGVRQLPSIPCGTLPRRPDPSWRGRGKPLRQLCCGACWDLPGVLSEIGTSTEGRRGAGLRRAVRGSVDPTPPPPLHLAVQSCQTLHPSCGSATGAWLSLGHSSSLFFRPSWAPWWAWGCQLEPCLSTGQDLVTCVLILCPLLSRKLLEDWDVAALISLRWVCSVLTGLEGSPGEGGSCWGASLAL